LFLVLSFERVNGMLRRGCMDHGRVSFRPLHRWLRGLRNRNRSPASSPRNARPRRARRNCLDAEWIRQQPSRVMWSSTVRFCSTAHGKLSNCDVPVPWTMLGGYDSPLLPYPSKLSDRLLRVRSARQDPSLPRARSDPSQLGNSQPMPDLSVAVPI